MWQMITFKICNWINSKKIVSNWWCIFAYRRQRWWWRCAQLRIRCGTQKHSTTNGVTQFQEGLAGWLDTVRPWNTIGDLLLSLFHPQKEDQSTSCMRRAHFQTRSINRSITMLPMCWQIRHGRNTFKKSLTEKNGFTLFSPNIELFQHLLIFIVFKNIYNFPYFTTCDFIWLK